MTRIGIPVVSPEGLPSRVNDHFAMSESFAILEAEGGRIVSLKIVHNVHHDEESAAKFLAEKGVGVVIAGRIGSCMTRIFHDRGVKVFSGAEGTVEEAFESYKAGTLAAVSPSPYQL